MIEMGLMFEYGYHRRVNLKKALAWYEKAASLGHVDAMVKAGWIWESHSFKDHDDHKAFLWYLKSAAMAYGNGECQLGFCYRDGIGTGKDMDRALICLEKQRPMALPKQPCCSMKSIPVKGQKGKKNLSSAIRKRAFPI